MRIYLQLDESTGVSNCNHLIVLVIYFDGADIKEDFLFCEELITNATSNNIFYIVKIFFEINDLKINTLGSTCINGAPTLLGNKSGVYALFKKEILDIRITHCYFHRNALESKTLPCKLNFFINLCVKVITELCINFGTNYYFIIETNNKHKNIRYIFILQCLHKCFCLLNHI